MAIRPLHDMSEREMLVKLAENDFHVEGGVVQDMKTGRCHPIVTRLHGRREFVATLLRMREEER